MKPKTTLKELLKPPFTSDLIGMIYDSRSRFIDVPGINWNKDNPEKWTGEGVAKIRGWGVFGYYENGAELQDEFCAFVVESINKIWAEKFGELKRWEMKRLGDVQKWFECPICGTGSKAGITSYCSSCGVRLLPPEEVQDVE